MTDVTRFRRAVALSPWTPEPSPPLRVTQAVADTPVPMPAEVVAVVDQDTIFLLHPGKGAWIRTEWTAELEALVRAWSEAAAEQ